MTRYAICFDVPGLDDPVFAWRKPGEPFGVTSSLAAATRFEDEASAERTLQNSFGAFRDCGVVVEVQP